MLIKTERLHIRRITEDDWQSIKAIRDDFLLSQYAQYDTPFSTKEEDMQEKVIWRCERNHL